MLTIADLPFLAIALDIVTAAALGFTLHCCLVHLSTNSRSLRDVFARPRIVSLATRIIYLATPLLVTETAAETPSTVVTNDLGCTGAVRGCEDVERQEPTK